jgi:hypothetical protein
MRDEGAMSNSEYRVSIFVAALILGAFAQPASALTMKQCSEKYKTAHDAGGVGSMSWNEFRAAECGTGASMAIKKTKAAPATKSAPASETAGASPTMQECSTRYQAAKSSGTLGAMTWNEFRSAGCPTTVAKRSGSMKPTMGSIFPASIDKKYTKFKAGKARMLTCRDQYRANKEAGVTEPKWTEEGGGYYSECNKRLSQQ